MKKKTTKNKTSFMSYKHIANLNNSSDNQISFMDLDTEYVE